MDQHIIFHLETLINIRIGVAYLYNDQDKPLPYSGININIFFFSFQVINTGQISLEDLLDMTDEQVCETLGKFGASTEECDRLNASLSCLRSVYKSGIKL